MFQRPDQVNGMKDALAIHRAVGADRPDAISGRYRTHVQYEQMREASSRHLAMQNSSIFPSLQVPMIAVFVSLVRATSDFLVATDRLSVNCWHTFYV